MFVSSSLLVVLALAMVGHFQCGDSHYGVWKILYNLHNKECYILNGPLLTMCARDCRSSTTFILMTVKALFSWTLKFPNVIYKAHEN